MKALMETSTPIQLSNVDSKLLRYNWEVLNQGMDRDGYFVLHSFFNPLECSEIASLYDNDKFFRSRVHMERYGFGKGEYRYFKYPLPDLIDQYRQAIYPYLAKIANDWNKRLGISIAYPLEHKSFLESIGKVANSDRPHYYLNMAQVIITACTRIFMVILFFQLKLQYFYQLQAMILLAESLL